MYINVGQMDGFDFNSLKDFIAENAEISNGDVTWTDVKNTFSLLEVRTEVMEKIIQSIHGAQYRGRTVRVESRGNRDAGIPRTRLRSDNRREGGGGYGGGGGRSYDKGSRYSDGGNRKSYGGRSGGGDRDRSSSKGRKKKSY